MEDAFFVGRVKGVGELDADVNGARNGKETEGNQFVEGLAFEEFHGDEVAAIVLFDGVNSADTGMIERGGSAGFAKETFESLFISMCGAGRNFRATRRPSLVSSAS